MSKVENSTSLTHSLLLFSEENGSAVENTIHNSGFEFSSDILPTFPGNVVTKPVPIMVEGTYHIANRATNKWEKVEIKASDIEDYLANTHRDVAINYNHKHDSVRGWVRTKGLAEVRVMDTRKGKKVALFSPLELTPEAAENVAKGLFRDVSIELKTAGNHREITGLALTAYPIMQNVQMFSNPVEGENIMTNTASIPQTPVEVTEVPEVAVAKTAEPVVKVVVKEFSQKQLDTIREAQMIVAEKEIRSIVCDSEGNVKLPEATIKTAAKLLLFANEVDSNETIQFSQDGGAERTNITELVFSLLKGVEAIQLFGESEGVSTSQIVGKIPEVTEEVVDGNFISRALTLAKESARLTGTAPVGV